jgi:hypothetical protein
MFLIRFVENKREMPSLKHPTVDSPMLHDDIHVGLL